MKNPELILQLQHLLKSHDYSYQFSEDSKVFSAGQRSYANIKRFIKDNQLEDETVKWLERNQKEKSYFK